MADGFFNEFRNGIQGAWTHAVFDLDTTAQKMMLRDEALVAVNLATQVDLSDIVAARVGTDQTLAGTTVGVVAVGVFDHTIVTWTAVTGASVESLDHYQLGGTDLISPLVQNIDSATGLPVTPNGGDITFDPAAGGLHSIGA